jgi:transcriptional regulator with XRE-family HTH domain
MTYEETLAKLSRFLQESPYTDVEICVITGLSIMTIGELRRGTYKYNVSLANFLAILGALDTTPAEFFGSN